MLNLRDTTTEPLSGPTPGPDDPEELLLGEPTFWQKAAQFLKVKHNSIINFIALAVAAGSAFGLFDLSENQLQALLAFVGGFFVLIGAKTVTANARYTGSALQTPPLLDGTDRVAIWGTSLSDASTRLVALDPVDPDDISSVAFIRAQHTPNESAGNDPEPGA